MAWGFMGHIRLGGGGGTPRWLDIKIESKVYVKWLILCGKNLMPYSFIFLKINTNLTN